MADKLRKSSYSDTPLRKDDSNFIPDNSRKDSFTVIETPVRNSRVSINGWDFRERVGSKRNARRNNQE